MRIRKNHAIRPQLRDQAIRRCYELLADLENDPDLDHSRILSLLNSEFDGDGKHILDYCLRHKLT